MTNHYFPKLCIWQKFSILTKVTCIFCNALGPNILLISRDSFFKKSAVSTALRPAARSNKDQRVFKSFSRSPHPDSLSWMSLDIYTVVISLMSPSQSSSQSSANQSRWKLVFWAFSTKKIEPLNKIALPHKSVLQIEQILQKLGRRVSGQVSFVWKSFGQVYFTPVNSYPGPIFSLNYLRS